MMKFALRMVMPVMAAAAFCACSGDDDDDLVGNWVRSNDFEGVARSNASSFVVNEYGYVCCGYDGKIRYNDLWEYNTTRGYWSQKADFPGAARDFAAAFSIEGNGYVGTGWDGATYTYYKDFYKYNAAADSWEQIADYGGTARHSAVAFAVAGKGYVGTGYDKNYQKDFFSYNPSTDSWEQIASIGGTKRQGASSFVFGDNAYVVCGENNGSWVNDFWMFDPLTESWTEKRKISNVSSSSYDDDYAITRSYAACFTMGSKAYITCGEQGSMMSTTWEYDPLTDLWVERTGFEATARTSPVAFSLNNRGFVVTGRSSSYRFDDMWEFKPYDEYNEYD